MFRCLGFLRDFVDSILFCNIFRTMHFPKYQLIACNMQYNIIPYCIIWYHIVWYGIILYDMLSYCMIWYHILSYFIIFYSIFHNFTEKSIKCTFWPGFLPLQGTPTGKNNGFLHHVSLFYRKIYKMHILVRIFAPARHTHRRK